MYKYEHGGDVYSQKTAANGQKFVDFSANINPLGLSEGVKAAIVNALDDCVNYPDAFCRDLAAAVGEYLGVPKENLFFGNGAADVLFRLALALKPKRALLFAPTFADYEKSLRSVDCQIDYYKLDESQDFVPTASLLDAVAPEHDIVVLCNPNNPTGQVIKREFLETVLAKCEECGAYLLVDECFMDFVTSEIGYSLRNLLADHKQLIILKAFTKTFAMPGIRLGYCLTANEELRTKLHVNGQDWSVSVLAQAAGIAALKEADYLEKSLQIIAAEREYLKEQLSLIGCKVYGSEANYVFFRKEKPENLREELHKRGFLIRSCANYHNLDNGYYRIAVRLPEENKALVAAMKEILL